MAGVEIEGVKFVALPPGLLQEALTAGPGWRALGERCYAASVAKCPVGKEQELGKDYGKPHSGVHLKDRMELRFETGVDPRILIGSTLTVNNDISLLGLVLQGTEAHTVTPVNAQALRFTAGGAVVFAQSADIPAHAPNPFVQKAMHEVCTEGGLANYL